MILQMLILFFVLVMILKLLTDLKRNKISSRRFLFWCLIWIALAVIVFFPQVIFFLSDLVGIERPKDLPIYVSIIILFFLIFKLTLKIERVEQEITTLVKNIALKSK